MTTAPYDASSSAHGALARPDAARRGPTLITRVSRPAVDTWPISRLSCPAWSDDRVSRRSPPPTRRLRSTGSSRVTAARSTALESELDDDALSASMQHLRRARRTPGWPSPAGRAGTTCASGPGPDPADPHQVARQVHRAPGVGARRPARLSWRKRHDHDERDERGRPRPDRPLEARPGLPGLHQGDRRRRSGMPSPARVAERYGYGGRGVCDGLRPGSRDHGYTSDAMPIGRRADGHRRRGHRADPLAAVQTWRRSWRADGRRGRHPPTSRSTASRCVTRLHGHPRPAGDPALQRRRPVAWPARRRRRLELGAQRRRDAAVDGAGLAGDRAAPSARKGPAEAAALATSNGLGRQPASLRRR